MESVKLLQNLASNAAGMSWPELIKKISLNLKKILLQIKKIGLTLLGIGLLIWLGIYTFFFDGLTNNANSITDYFWWFGDYWQISLLITLVAGWMTWWLISYPFSKLSRTKLHVITVTSLLISVALTYFNQERTLLGKYIQNDDPGAVKTYISKKRLSSFKMLSGILIDASNVEHAYAVSKGLFPKQVDLYSSDVQLAIVAGEFPFFDSGNPKYYRGTKDQNEIYRLYDRMGFDPISGKLLVKFEEKEIEELKASIKAMVEKRRSAEAAAAQIKRDQEIAEAQRKQKVAQEAAAQKAKEDQIAEQKRKQEKTEEDRRERIAAAERMREIAANDAREHKARQAEERRRAEIENSSKQLILNEQMMTFSIPSGHEITQHNDDCYFTVDGNRTGFSRKMFIEYSGRVVLHARAALLSRWECRAVIKRFE